ncbi:MAG TPA: hypothetical protein VGU01_14775 [Sphingomicrobium sp.]|nr:hypothetical protein [Sphingomicrobium sp.]
MSDDFQRRTSEQLISFYTQFRAELDQKPTTGRCMPYQWWERPGRLSGIWMVWDQMLQEYARELANIINDLTNHVDRLRAWHIVVDPLSDEGKLAATHEFVDQLGTIALGLPYAIKSRFAVAAGHLCHQANMSKGIDDWKDEFPEGNLYLHHIEPFGNVWKKFRPFVLALEPLAGQKFRDASANFRHAYNHGFSPNFVVGVSGSVERKVGNDGRVGYTFNQSEPFTLAEVADVLEIERDHCYRAFEAFQELIGEQMDRIISFESVPPN